MLTIIVFLEGIAHNDLPDMSQTVTHSKSVWLVQSFLEGIERELRTNPEFKGKL